MASIAAGVSVPTGAPRIAEITLHTYLRTVTQGGSVGNNNNGGGGNMRGSTYSVQRVNIPLPITALVQRGNSGNLPAQLLIAIPALRIWPH
ncbi:unnamed protein product [Ceratitis capitata]|uniref:(Mediterranean fruit fly) hypothetical protein n=1 Tax=Ceratitis capitata TaxID=7213 RepID=A0A811TZB0_CERCA|nr:unnamed protein product [Ceratitis capitata]